MCHAVGEDGCMMNLTKASNVLCALLVLHGVCVWGPWVPLSCGNKEHPRKCLRSYSRTPTP